MNLPILARHNSVGAALWMYEYLRDNTKTVDSDWMPVADGLWISDTQLGFRLDVGESTIRRWRKKLERLGYLYSETVKPRYRKLWLANENAWPRELALLQAAGDEFCELMALAPTSEQFLNFIRRKQ